MFVTILKSKIHRARVTDTNVNYEGSITIDRELMNTAGIMDYEQVQVVNVNNGVRFVTYAIPGGSGEIIINGAAARLAEKNDVIIILSYAQMKQKKAAEYQPVKVYVDELNAISEIID